MELQKSWAAFYSLFYIIRYDNSILILLHKTYANSRILIIIAPLITITYSMDKMKDGQAQALNTWMREFMFNVLIQPFPM